MKPLLVAMLLVAVPTAAFAFASARSAAGELNVGDKVPDRSFSQVVWNGDGASGIQDWRGEPVLVDFWGKN